MIYEDILGYRFLFSFHLYSKLKKILFYLVYKFTYVKPHLTY